MERINITEFLELGQTEGVMFDVRTPAEFEKGHIPGAVNLPLLTNEERVVVGTMYKQEGRHPAILAGLDFIGPRMRELVEIVESHVGPPDQAKPVLVHCWRGGMRSGSVAWLLELYGFSVQVLDGGYKKFRNWVIETMIQPIPIIVLGGRTGGGKTEVLGALEQLGEAVIDLEGLAHHRGSAFGALCLPDQPSQSHFENKLAMEVDRVSKLRRAVWVEDESRMVGIRHLPNEFYAALKAAQVIAMNVPIEFRLNHLVNIYGEASTELLADSFERIKKRAGGENTTAALKSLAEGDLREAARVALVYYDKCYDYGLNRRDDSRVHFMEFKTETYTPEALAPELIQYANDLGLRTTCDD